ncbi:MAG TPA: DUF3991 and TOPRIM domain-containing protein, partial [Opitutaceae bacterium]|nr:DUF3991 and TOPRIM domain-containing protein [Opitutaceae bacterium]
FAQVASKFGLARTSENPTGRAHIPARELRAATAAQLNPINEAKRKIETAANARPVRLQVAQPSIASLLTAKGRTNFVELVQHAAESQIREVRNRIQKSVTTSLDELSQIVASAVLLREENDSMKRYQIELIREIPLDRVTELYLGVTPKREGSSLVAETDDHKIVITGEKFKDFKSPQGNLGGGAIDLAMHLLGCDFKRAIAVLAADFPDAVAGTIRQHYLRRAKEETAVAKAAHHRPLFEEQLAKFARPESSKLTVVRKYLHEERMIPLSIIDALIDRGDLWANKWGSCVFAHRDLSRVIRGCTIRGATGSSFKQVLGAKKDAWFTVGTPLATASRLVLTESPIDALSFDALGLRFANDVILSTAGQAEYEPFIEFGRPLLLAQDADESGNAQANMIAPAASIAGLQVERHTPARGKDWNEQLTYERDQQRLAAARMAERKIAIARTLGAPSHGYRNPSPGGPNPGFLGLGPTPDSPRRGPVH